MKQEIVVRVMNNVKKSASASLKSSSSSAKSPKLRSSKEHSDNEDGGHLDPSPQQAEQQQQAEETGDNDSSSVAAGSERRASVWFNWGTGRSPNPASNDPTFPAPEESPIVDTEHTHTTTEDDIRQPNESWISWGRKLSRSQNLSSDSLRKLFQDGTNKTSIREPSNELLSNPKAIITHDAQGRSIEVKNNRSASWSFWNSSNVAVEGENKIVEDAVLFESQEVPAGKKAAPTKKPLLPNIIVPTFEEVLPQESLAKRLYNMVSFSQPTHLERVRPKTFKRVLIIGVHGFFPNKMLRPLIGEPTGTSIKFANEAEKAVLKWSKKHRLDIAIQKIALEKEGRIFDRVEYFYDVMEKWREEIQKSDFVFFACHSQGTPVSVMLLSRLLETGIISNDHFEKKLGILAMAGVNNGPYYGVDQKFFVKAYSTIEHDSMRELFDFQNFDSIQSKKYLEALRVIIANNTKICFVGSIDDQLVPLYSAIASHIEHPNLYRACYIDGGSNTPTFVSRVVSISLWLKNIGYSDHGIIKEISNSLAGPLTGGGHSKIYNDPNVYELAINFILGTNDLNVSHPQPVHFTRFDIKALNNNPYHLPWCMRGLITESYQHIPEGAENIGKISEEFDEWKPESKVLKDLKYRLSAIKAKL